MKITEIPALPPTYNPYDECCCGSHEGETVILHADNGHLQIIVEEMKSGIGPSYNIRVEGAGKNMPVASVYIGDDGELAIHNKQEAR